MSQFSPVTNLLLACLCALGLAPALGLPWYAVADPVEPTASKGTIELTAEGVTRWFTSGGRTTTGAEALTGAETALMVVAAVTIVLCALVLAPPMRSSVRGVLKLVPLAAPVIVLVHLFHQPGSNAGTDLRWGVFVTLGLSLFMASSAYQGAEIQERKPAPVPYRPPAPPTYP